MAPKKAPEPTRYDDQVKNLQAILQRLESEDLPFDDILGLYKEGQALVKACQQYLDEAELRFTQAMEEADGTVGEAPLHFEEEAEDDED